MSSAGRRAAPSAVDAARVEAATFAAQVRWLPEIRSTNDLALELAERAEPPLPLVIGAERQTGGRGRGAHRWWSPPGALLFSLLLDREQLGAVAPPQLSLWAALAVCETVGRAAPLAHPRVKWPNDVLFNGRKGCGILTELPPRRPDRIVLGVGLNVNNTLAQAPLSIRDSATSLADETGRRFDRTELLIGVLRSLERALNDRLRPDAPPLSRRWRERCMLYGRRVSVASARGATEGVCRGVDDDGALVVDTARGVRRCLSGEVRLLDG